MVTFLKHHIFYKSKLTITNHNLILELAKKDEPSTDSSLKPAKKSLQGANYEERDMTKESESADDYSENEESQQKVSTRNII